MVRRLSVVNPSNHRAARLCSLAAILAVAVILLATPPAPAQYTITPDRSIVNVGPQAPFVIRTNMNVTPVVVNGRFVRISASYSAMILDPTKGYPGTGLIRPFYANDRAKAANFYGSPNYNPAPVVTGPWQVWW
jgi:hypothetical protein